MQKELEVLEKTKEKPEALCKQETGLSVSRFYTRGKCCFAKRNGCAYLEDNEEGYICKFFEQ